MQLRSSFLVVAVTIGAANAVAAPFTYTNEQFGTVWTFPDDIFTDRQAEPDNGDGQEWLSADGARLICSGILNVDEDTPTGFVAAEKAGNEAGFVVA
jgi:hypothetical protein